MPPSHLAPWAQPPSGRYLSFAEREEIALLRAQGHGVREIAGWFDDYNENHPHSGLRMRSPREFRRAHQPAEVSG